MPFSGEKPSSVVLLRNMTQRTWAPSSFKEKYQWPLAAFVMLDTSPDTQMSSRLVSSRFRARRLSSETVSIFSRPAGIDANKSLFVMDEILSVRTCYFMEDGDFSLL